MRVTWKGSVLLAPVPSVVVSCGNEERANFITIGWVGVVSTHPPRVYISVRPERHSHGMIKESGEFVINLTDASFVREVDYIGNITGRKVDKAKKLSLETCPSATVAPPTLTRSPLSLECKVADIYPYGSHDMFVADVTSVTVDERFIDENGRLRLDKASLISFCHGEYFTLGKKLGKIGMAVTKKKKRATKPKQPK